MRDMEIRKFESCCRYMGFKPIPQGTQFVSDDGQLRVQAAVESRPIGGTRINRRETLKRLAEARKQQQSEAPSVGAPRASGDHNP